MSHRRLDGCLAARCLYMDGHDVEMSKWTFVHLYTASLTIEEYNRRTVVLYVHVYLMFVRHQTLPFAAVDGISHHLPSRHSILVLGIALGRKASRRAGVSNR